MISEKDIGWLVHVYEKKGPKVSYSVGTSNFRDNRTIWGVLREFDDKRIVLNPAAIYGLDVDPYQTSWIGIEADLRAEESAYKANRKVTTRKTWIHSGSARLPYAPRNPKPDWLIEFEDATQYNPERVKAYFAGMRFSKFASPRNYDLCSALCSAQNYHEMLSRLHNQLIFNGLDMNVLLEDMKKGKKCPPKLNPSQ